jgi:hypothetical protein
VQKALRDYHVEIGPKTKKSKARKLIRGAGRGWWWGCDWRLPGILYDAFKQCRFSRSLLEVIRPLEIVPGSSIQNNQKK